MSGHEVPASALLTAFAVTGGLAWSAGRRRRGVFAVGGGLLAVQGVLHLVFGTAGAPGAGHHGMPVAHQPAAMSPEAVVAAASAHGQGSDSLAMTAAHLAAALVCGLWLARGEAAFFRIAHTVGTSAFTPLRLLLAVVRAPALPKPVRLRRSRAAHRRGHGVVLAHTLSRRGPPRAPSTRATAPALLSV
ncbi:hypothetical protein [Streptomyces albidochromogenes]|uniref:hypothetical protein n=1 Tax=Streptomyces albidochromogenes TaxID=329524 RepID=UPI00142EDDFB|nr:hypothetical protein [Streptomyces albidochromogenes]